MLGWLLGLLGDEGARSVGVRAWEQLVGNPAERAIEGAIRNACRVVTQEVVAYRDPVEAATILVELVGGATPGRLRASSALADLEEALGSALEGLWTEAVPGQPITHAESVGLACTADELVRLLVDAIVSSLGVESDISSPVASLIALFGTQRNQRDIEELQRATGQHLRRAGSEVQATRTNAWISVNEDIPVVYVLNNSDSPIFDVRPTPALVGYLEDGSIGAQVGHSPLGVVRQIDPHSGWAWPMSHCPGWGGVPYVRGDVHVHFRDAAGESWLLAHSHLSPQADPWGPAPTAA